MPQWDKRHHETLKTVWDVKCYMDGMFHILYFDGYNHEDSDDPYYKTFVLRCGTYDGEYIDLFQLQDWFDANREWINELRREAGHASREDL